MWSMHTIPNGVINETVGVLIILIIVWHNVIYHTIWYGMHTSFYRGAWIVIRQMFVLSKYSDSWEVFG